MFSFWLCKWHIFPCLWFAPSVWGRAHEIPARTKGYQKILHYFLLSVGFICISFVCCFILKHLGSFLILAACRMPGSKHSLPVTEWDESRRRPDAHPSSPPLLVGGRGPPAANPSLRSPENCAWGEIGKCTMYSHSCRLDLQLLTSVGSSERQRLYLDLWARLILASFSCPWKWGLLCWVRCVCPPRGRRGWSVLLHKQEMEIEMLWHCWNMEQLDKEFEPCESVESDISPELRCEVQQQCFPKGREGQEQQAEAAKTSSKRELLS